MSPLPTTDPDELGPRLEWQLRAALDRVRPPHSAPRYAQAPAGARRWGLAQGVLAAGVAGLMVVTLLAAASSRAIDLQHRIVNTIQPATQPTAGPEASPSPSPVQAQLPAPPSEETSPRPEPSDSPEPTEKPEPGDTQPGQASPEPTGDHSGSTPASPTPTDH